MYRIAMEKNEAGVLEERIYGVLTDFDLASWRCDLDKDYTKTSQQRTGTPPYMAHGLLDGSEPFHLYRHDLESLFYIMLILATHYEIKAPEEGDKGGIRLRGGELPYQRWFNQPLYEDLADFKRDLSFQLEGSQSLPGLRRFS
jgi:serine/threonine protein kinase